MMTSPRGILRGLFRGVSKGGWFLARAVAIAWAALAIFYSNLPWPGLRLALALGFFGFAI